MGHPPDHSRRIGPILTALTCSGSTGSRGRRHRSDRAGTLGGVAHASAGGRTRPTVPPVQVCQGGRHRPERQGRNAAGWIRQPSGDRAAIAHPSRHARRRAPFRRDRAARDSVRAAGPSEDREGRGNAGRRCSASITCITALISARCVNACGKLPRWRPVPGSISSPNKPSGLANDRTFSQRRRARSTSPISARADTSQNEQIVKVPSSPDSPSSVCSTR